MDKAADAVAAKAGEDRVRVAGARAKADAVKVDRVEADRVEADRAHVRVDVARAKAARAAADCRPVRNGLMLMAPLKGCPTRSRTLSAALS